MANVDNLKDSLTELPRNEAIELLLDIRQARREVIESKSRKRSTPKKTKSTKKKKKQLLSVVAGMTKEQARLMLEQLKDGD